MNFYNKSSAPFLIENFNNKPKEFTPSKQISNKIPIDPSLDWGQNRHRMQLQCLSRDNPFNNENFIQKQPK